MGLIGGFLLEFSYRSIKARKLIVPKFINFQMYGLTGAFLVFIYFLEIPLYIKVVLIFAFPTLVEFTTGYIYLTITDVYLWDYSKELYNFKKLVCPLFSIYWFVIALSYYYVIIPLFNY